MAIIYLGGLRQFSSPNADVLQDVIRLYCSKIQQAAIKPTNGSNNVANNGSKVRFSAPSFIVAPERIC